MLRSVLVSTAALLLLAPMPIRAASPDDNMSEVWPKFQAAVAAGNRDQVTAMMKFPLEGWDENDLGTQITRDELLKGYAKAFTLTVKKGIAAGKPVKQSDGSYTVEWHSGPRKTRYTLIFENPDGAGFVCTALATGDA